MSHPYLSKLQTPTYPLPPHTPRLPPPTNLPLPLPTYPPPTPIYTHPYPPPPHLFPRLGTRTLPAYLRFSPTYAPSRTLLRYAPSHRPTFLTKNWFFPTLYCNVCICFDICEKGRINGKKFFESFPVFYRRRFFSSLNHAFLTHFLFYISHDFHFRRLTYFFKFTLPFDHVFRFT